MSKLSLQLIDLMYTIELGLWLSSLKTEDEIVTQVCLSKLPYLVPPLSIVVKDWITKKRPFKQYSKFMDEVGL